MGGSNSDYEESILNFLNLILSNNIVPQNCEISPISLENAVIVQECYPEEVFLECWTSCIT